MGQKAQRRENRVKVKPSLLGNCWGILAAASGKVCSKAGHGKSRLFYFSVILLQ